jgi:hypothetical protein
VKSKSYSPLILSSSVFLVALASLTLAGCGGGGTSLPPVDPGRQSKTPAVLDAGIQVEGASGPTFTPFSSRTGVPPVAANSPVMLRASITNDTFGEPITKVWMTLPDAPDFTWPFQFDAATQPAEAIPYTYSSGSLALPLGPGAHQVIIYAQDSGNDIGQTTFTVQVAAPG